MADVQNHIHLALTLGGTPEFAPVYQWKTTDRVMIPEFVVEISQGLTGVRFDYALEDVNYDDFGYDIQLHDDSTSTALAKLAILQTMRGKRLYLVDHLHVDDGVDHTDDVKLVRMTRMGPIEISHLTMQIIHVPIQLSSLEQNGA